jgi:rhodanese-related sulfurtransferase
MRSLIMADIENTVNDIKSNVKDVLDNQDAVPVPANFQQEADVHELKSRLDWGEPALTILDVRSREEFNHGRILGAMCAPVDTLREGMDLHLESNRDIYVYGTNEQEAAEGTQILRESGHRNVAVLKGGLEAWMAAGGSTEGLDIERAPVSKGSYNIVDRAQEFEREQQNEHRN